MRKVYLWQQDGVVLFHTDLDAAQAIDGLTAPPELTVEVAEWERTGGVARIVDDKIVLGADEADTLARECVMRIAKLKAMLAQTDYVAAKIAEGAATVAEYAEVVAQRQGWRDEINELSASLPGKAKQPKSQA